MRTGMIFLAGMFLAFIGSRSPLVWATPIYNVQLSITETSDGGTNPAKTFKYNSKTLKQNSVTAGGSIGGSNTIVYSPTGGSCTQGTGCVSNVTTNKGSANGTATLGALHLAASVVSNGSGGDKISVIEAFTDTLTFIAPTINTTTPLSFRLTMVPMGALSTFAQSQGGFPYAFASVTTGMSIAGANLEEYICSNNGGSCGSSSTVPGAVSQIVTVYAGQQYTLDGLLVGQAEADGLSSLQCTGQYGINENCGVTNYGASADILFADTVNFYVQPLTPGASYITASGQMYSPTSNISATPEPASFWLFATGILGTFGWAKYRKVKLQI